MPTPQRPAIDQLIADAFAIEREAAREAGALGFLARSLVQATLPHKRVQGHEFSRVNGNYTLSIVSTSKSGGLPFGPLPRLLLCWITTEAVKTKSRELVLGDSLTAFMRELGLTATGGKWGSVRRVREQATRLFDSTITAHYRDHSKTVINKLHVCDRATLWWDHTQPEQRSLWKSEVILSETFFKEIIDRPVPIDLRAVKALKRSAMALDLYVWMTFRLSYLDRPIEIPWEALANQFGSDYGRLRAFKAALLTELKKVVVVYPTARVTEGETGLRLSPSPTHVGRGRGE